MFLSSERYNLSLALIEFLYLTPINSGSRKILVKWKNDHKRVYAL